MTLYFDPNKAETEIHSYISVSPNLELYLFTQPTNIQLCYFCLDTRECVNQIRKRELEHSTRVHKTFGATLLFENCFKYSHFDATVAI